MLTVAGAVGQSVAELFGYLVEQGEPIYCAAHCTAVQPKGTVLLCGSFGLESTQAAIVWTSWARRLANAGWDAIRFDWRGTGESGGDFGDASLAGWDQDLRRVYSFARHRERGPVVLMGFRAGALLAANAFSATLGDALVLWEPPLSGQAYVMEVLRRKIAADYTLGGAQAGKTRKDYLAELESGVPVEVEGFVWSPELCRSLLAAVLPDAPTERPRLSITRKTHPLPRPPFWEESPTLQPDVSAWFDATLDFLAHLELGSRSIANRPETASEGLQERRTASAGARTSPCIVPEASFGHDARSILTWPHEGLELLATHHRPKQPSGVAMLCTSFGPVPRCGHAGLATRICRQAAAAGIHAFRVDLPALGDSQGELSGDSAAWRAAVREGSMIDAVIGSIRHIAERFGIEKFLMAGHCAAALTAVYAYRVERRIVSLLLLEPEFHGEARPMADTGTDEPGVLVGAVARVREAGKNLAQRVLATRSPAWRLSPISQSAVQEAMWKRRLTINMNMATAWRSIVENRVPALVITAEGRPHEFFFLRAHAAALSARVDGSAGASSVQHLRLPETNHGFTTGRAIEKIELAVHDWLHQSWNGVQAHG